VRALYIVVSLVVLGSSARADYYADQQNEHLRRIEYGQSRVEAPNSWFDGKNVNPNGRIGDGVGECKYAISTFQDEWKLVDAAFKASERGKAVEKKHAEIAPFCAAMVAAMEVIKKEQAAKEARAAEDAKLEGVRLSMRGELMGKLQPYLPTLNAVMAAWITIQTTTGFSHQPNDLAQYKKDLAEVQKICGAYPKIANPTQTVPSQQLRDFPADICKVAALGPEEAVRQTRKIWLLHNVASDGERYVRYIQPMIDGTEKAVADEHQLLAFDRKAWLAKTAAGVAKDFEEIKEPMPADLYPALGPAADKLRAKLDTYGANDTFTKPPFRDAQVEGLVKKQAAKDLKGSKVFKIGLDYKSWVAYDERTWVKSDATYDYYRVSPGKNRYKRGWILVQLAGQPYCQAREFIVSRVRSGPIHVDSLDGGGRFMKCD